MSDATRLSQGGRVVGFVMLFVGVSVFAIRLQHPGPYAWPEGGNLRAGVAALVILASPFALVIVALRLDPCSDAA